MNDLKYKIISVKSSIKNKHLFQVILENGDKYIINEQSILNYNIKENIYIKEKIFHQALDQSQREQIKNKIILLLSYRSRSKKELKDILLAKNFKIENIINVIKKLEERGYINDLVFAKMYASHMIKEKYFGRYLVEKKLLSHKIEFSIMDPIITQLYLEFPANYLINKILKKKKWTQKNLLKNKLKIINHLKRKGFHWDDIKPLFSDI